MTSDQVNFCIRCGTSLITQDCFGRPRPTCPACGWVYFPDPKVAVAALVCDHDKILLVRRTNQPMRGYWTLPAGFMDAGEDPAHAAERECREETGLVVKVAHLLDVVAGQAHARGADILIVYQAELLTGELQAGDDADSAGFFDLADLPPLAFDSTLAIIATWQRNK
jgi:8-oxo-dGTP diphosphatase